LQSDDHKHSYRKGVCSICGVSESWPPPGKVLPHEHQFEPDRCVVENDRGIACGARRTCKPTIRANVMLPMVPVYGVFKVESHGFNTAENLSSLAGALANSQQPVPARLVMTPEERVRFFRPGKPDQKVETVNFFALDIVFDFTPGQVHGGQLASAAAARLTAITQPAPQHAIGAGPERLTNQDVRRLADQCSTPDEVRDLWRRANHAGALTIETAKIITERGEYLRNVANGEPIDAEIIDDDDEDWPATAQPAGGAS
jgi:hypothetical protein